MGDITYPIKINPATLARIDKVSPMPQVLPILRGALSRDPQEWVLQTVYFRSISTLAYWKEEKNVNNSKTVWSCWCIKFRRTMCFNMIFIRVRKSSRRFFSILNLWNKWNDYGIRFIWCIDVKNLKSGILVDKFIRFLHRIVIAFTQTLSFSSHIKIKKL